MIASRVAVVLDRTRLIGVLCLLTLTSDVAARVGSLHEGKRSEYAAAVSRGSTKMTSHDRK